MRTSTLRSARRLPAAAIAVAASLCSLLIAGPPAAAGVDDAEETLAQRYAPLVRLQQQVADSCDRGEPYQPTDVEAVLGDDQVALRGPWQPADLIKVAPEGADLEAGLTGYHLDFPGDPLRPGCTYAEWSAMINAEHPMTVYAHVAADRRHPDQIALQYWFFYVFNDYNNTHEGDWESIQLVFDAASAEEALETTPVSVGYSQHGGAERALWGDDKLEIVDDTHPVVYPAAGSHANHYTEALYLGRGSEGLGCDDTTDPQGSVVPEVVVVSDAATSRAEHPWLAFEGRWGERQESVFNGPTGPAMKDLWVRPIRSAQETWRDDSTTVPAGGLLGPDATAVFCTVIGGGSNLLRETLDRPWVGLVLLGLVVALVWTAAGRTRWRPATPLPARTPRAWGQSVSAALRMVRLQPGLFVLFAAVLVPLTVTTGILAAIQASQPDSTDLSAPTDEMPAVLAVVALALAVVTVLVYVVLAAAVAWALRRLDEGHSVTTLDAVRAALGRWRHLLAVAALYYLVSVLLTMLVATIPIAAYFLVSRAYAIAAVMTEDRSARSALRRSADVVRGRWWRHAAVLAIVVGTGIAAGPIVGIVLLLGTDLAPTTVNAASAVTYAVAMPVVALIVTYLFLSAAATRDEATEPPAAPRVVAGAGR